MKWLNADLYSHLGRGSHWLQMRQFFYKMPFVILEEGFLFYLVDDPFTEFLLYTTPNGKVKVEIFLRNENVWLTQGRIANLFGVDRSVITKHLQNIYEEGELGKETTCAKIAQVQNEGAREVTRQVEFYNLDAILSVGYRVNSRQATLFRIWATERLKEYIIKGFTMDDERLKNPNNIFGKDCFLPRFRINCIGRSVVRLPRKLFLPAPTAPSLIWG